MSKERRPFSPGTVRGRESDEASVPQPLEGAPERVVAIGASAGGLKAFNQLFERLPARSGLAFVLIQHLQPTRATLLPNLLSRRTSMRVIEAEDGMNVEPDYVYVVPRNENMTIEKGVLRLSPPVENLAPQHPIDFFMRSLAEEKRNNAVGVVLSGTGSDGTIGLMAIKAKGGVTFAQNENSAEHYDMAHSAIMAGCVDFELPPDRIAEELARFSDVGKFPAEAGRNVAEFNGSFNEILQLLRGTTGVDPSVYKLEVVQECIARRIDLHHLDGLDAYADYLRVHSEEADRFYQDLDAGGAGFFRDPGTFAALKENFFDEMVQRHASSKPLRVWVPGCGTGEDAYSTAIAFYEFAEKRAEHTGIEIFVTDSNLKTIERARAGIYSQSIADDVSPERLSRFFDKRGSGFQINRSIRSLCIFARHNLLTDPPLSRMDLVVFRYRLNNLAQAAWEKTLSGLHYSLKPGGLLLLDSQETARSFECRFKLASWEHKIYSKIPVPAEQVLPSLAAYRPETEDREGGLEELRTSIEKLATLNEELEITHEELRGRNIELTESNEKVLRINAELENLLSSIQIPIVMVDQSYLIRRFTTTAGLLLKLRDDDVGRPITDLNLPVDRWDLMRMLDEAMSTTRFAEREVQARNGCWYSLRVQPYKTPKKTVEGAVVAMMNVDRLKRDKERLRLLIEQMVAGIAEVDLSGKFTNVNQRYCEITGLTRAELLNTNVRDVTHPEEWPRNAELYRRLYAEGESFFIEKRYKDKNDSEVWVNTHVSPIRNVENKIEGAVAVVIDVTDRKRAEQALRAAYEQAEAATRAKDEFLSVVSHELRTPLVSILGYTQLLNVATPDAALIRRVIEVVEKNSKIQLQLIEDLLDTARMMSGKLRLEVQPLDLVGVINAAVDVVRPAAQAKGIELHSAFDPLAAQVTGDPERLQQTVWNLLSNAIKFTPKDGRVEVTLSRVDPCVEIAVSDTGKGIDPGFLLHVFERFRQRDMSSTRRSGGLGLGLALVKHLVELHGGTVEAASEGAGRGSTFKVRLPMRAVYAMPYAEPELPRPVTHANLLAGVYILVVDDQYDVRTLLTLTLESYGAKVQAAESGQEALDLLNRQMPNEQFDVLICDIAMPDEDGYAVLRKVRALPPEKGGDIPAIALTAYGRAEYRVQALEAGFQSYVVKPVRPDDLVAIVQDAIKQLIEKRA
jgi:two-component system CheB/CheR fusion protein